MYNAAKQLHFGNTDGAQIYTHTHEAGIEQPHRSKTNISDV